MVSHSSLSKVGWLKIDRAAGTALGLLGARAPGGAVCYTATRSGWAGWLAHDVWGC